jgi:hypothetical protein
MGKITGSLYDKHAHVYGSVKLNNMAEAGEGPETGGPVSFADLGIPQPPQLQNTIFGKVNGSVMSTFSGCLTCDCVLKAKVLSIT